MDHATALERLLEARDRIAELEAALREALDERDKLRAFIDAHTTTERIS